MLGIQLAIQQRSIQTVASESSQLCARFAQENFMGLGDSGESTSDQQLLWIGRSPWSPHDRPIGKMKAWFPGHPFSRKKNLVFTGPWILQHQSMFRDTRRENEIRITRTENGWITVVLTSHWASSIRLVRDLYRILRWIWWIYLQYGFVWK